MIALGAVLEFGALLASHFEKRTGNIADVQLVFCQTCAGFIDSLGRVE